LDEVELAAFEEELRNEIDLSKSFSSGDLTGAVPSESSDDLSLDFESVTSPT
jgi:hypothetical protein